MRRLAHEPSVDAINRRLIHRLDDSRQVRSKLVLADDARRVPGRVEARDRLASGASSFARAAEFIECQRHGLDILLPGFAHQTDKGAGIHPCR